MKEGKQQRGCARLITFMKEADNEEEEEEGEDEEEEKEEDLCGQH